MNMLFAIICIVAYGVPGEVDLFTTSHQLCLDRLSNGKEHAGYGGGVVLRLTDSELSVINVPIEPLYNVETCAATERHVAVWLSQYRDIEEKYVHEILICTHDMKEVRRIENAGYPYAARDKIVFYDYAARKVVILDDALKECCIDESKTWSVFDFSVTGNILTVMSVARPEALCFDLVNMRTIPGAGEWAVGMLSFESKYSLYWGGLQGYIEAGQAYINSRGGVVAFMKKYRDIRNPQWLSPNVLSYHLDEPKGLECLYDAESGCEWIIPEGFRCRSLDANKRIVTVFRVPEFSRSDRTNSEFPVQIPLILEERALDDIVGSSGVFSRPIYVMDSPMVLDPLDSGPIFLTVPSEKPQCEGYRWYYNGIPLPASGIDVVGDDRRILMIAEMKKTVGGVFRCDGLKDGKVQFSWIIEAISKQYG